MRVGIDFDNTIICYDGVFLEQARQRGLVPADFTGAKRAVRDAVRLLPGGEASWQRLQGYAYGRGIDGAHCFAGLDAFLARARAAGARIVVVSHKTEYGHHDPAGVNLRDAARRWMHAQGLFAGPGHGLSKSDVHFADTRAEKLAKIRETGCALFIDDLEEVLGDPAFPAEVRRILFSSDGREGNGLPYPVLPSWAAIEEHIFGTRVRT